MDWLIVGLGNPGKQYAETRHNIGWKVAETFASKYTSLAAQHDAVFKPGGGSWYEARCLVHHAHVLVILPTTYMNRSGIAVAHAARLYCIPTNQIVAIVDEYNFPVGRIHLKNSGSDGGHNGIASLIAELGTPHFFRLRCGIDKRFGPNELVEYVLAPFAPDELSARDSMISSAIQALELLITHGAAKAMQQVNTRP